MQCKFASNGLAIDYFGTVKPCCVYEPDDRYRLDNHIRRLDLETWHQSPTMQALQKDLANGVWPAGCVSCQKTEEQGRKDSIRLNGAAYDHYQARDLTLEIRGGSTCNLACQTCWPQASSRVAQYYDQAGMAYDHPEDQDWDVDLLGAIAPRLKDIVILGGEPFFDKRCQRLIDWLDQEGVQANLTIFTNGSVLDRTFIQNYQGRLTLVFSIDATDRPSEYIRFGSEWSTVKQNYEWARSITKVETRVNITTSPYNYHYLGQLLTWLLDRWPSVVSFGCAGHNTNSTYMDESAIPLKHRKSMIACLTGILPALLHANIPDDQKTNAVKTLQAIVNNLANLGFDPHKHRMLVDFIHRMDRVKRIDIFDYCEETARYLDMSPGMLANTSPVFFLSDR